MTRPLAIALVVVAGSALAERPVAVARGGGCGSERCALPGGCIDAGEEDPLNECMICDPDRDPWGYSPRFDAVPCDDGNACTTGDRCDGSRFGPPLGVCFGGPPLPEGTGCDDGLPCTVGDRCDASARCVPASCLNEFCSPLCPDAT
jgi:hypothetical protein